MLGFIFQHHGTHLGNYYRWGLQMMAISWLKNLQSPTIGSTDVCGVRSPDSGLICLELNRESRFFPQSSRKNRQQARNPIQIIQARIPVAYLQTRIQFMIIFTSQLLL
jgi:hypothetical protein